MASCVRTIHEQRRAHTLLRALCCSERASTASVGRPVYRCRLTSYFTFYFCSAKALHRAQGRKRSPPQAHRDVPRPRMPRRAHYKALRCALHTSTRVQSTLVTHAPCVRASPAMHMLSRGNTRSRQKAWLLPCSSHWPLADRRPARRWHIWLAHALQTRSPSPLRAIPMHRRHAVHAIHLHRCTLPPCGRET